MIRILLIFAVLMISSLCATAQTIAEGTYVIRSSVNQNFVIDLDCGRTTNGSLVHLWTYYGSRNQLWCVKHNQGAIVIQSAVDPNYVVDLASINAKDGGTIHLWAFHGGNNQRWFPQYDNGAYILRSADNQNFVIDLDAGRAIDDGLIHLWTYYKGANNQKWIFQRVDDPNSSSSSGHKPEFHSIVCPVCGGGGTIPYRNYATCPSCGGVGVLTSYQ